MKTEKEILTFGDLKIGDKFIAFPIDGDNEGHGGYKGDHYVFIKVIEGAELENLSYNSIKLSTGVKSMMPEEMGIIKVQI